MFQFISNLVNLLNSLVLSLIVLIFSCEVAMFQSLKLRKSIQDFFPVGVFMRRDYQYWWRYWMENMSTASSVLTMSNASFIRLGTLEIKVI